MSGVAIGIDVGSLGLRVAWSGQDGPPVELDDLVPVLDQPWLTAELRPTRVGFAAVRQQRSPAAVHRLVTELAAVRKRVEADSGAEVDRVVLTVPARMESIERRALREAARSAGFTDVHLMNDAIAAVLGEDTAGPARTVLVYSLGYSGFEVGLLRLARRQVRVLHHMAADTPSGAGMDSWIMKAWLSVLGERDLAAIGGWTGQEWARLRGAAEEMKHQLAAGGHVDRGWPPWSTDQAPALATPTPEMFREFADYEIAATTVQVREVLAVAGLTARDIDTVLLVGGCTTLPAVRTMLAEELGSTARPTGPNHLARGAAVYGAQLRRTGAAEDAELIDATDRPHEPADLALPAPAGARGTPPVAAADPLADARRLWADGRPDEARTVLTSLIEQARALLQEIGEAAPVAEADTEALLPESTAEARARARRAINRAANALKKGRLADAVNESHQAWDLARDLDDVFQQMIDVHLGAARAAATPDRFADAQRWLLCARTHARFNEEVADYLLERTLTQARHHHDRGNTAEAVALLEECTHLNPDHPGVHDFRAELAARRSG